MNVIKRIKKQFIFGVINNIFGGTHAFEIKRKLLNCCEGVKVGAGTQIVTPIHLPWLSTLEIGENCWIGRDFTIEGNGAVYIGDNCDLAPGVICVTGSHQIGDSQRRAGAGYNRSIKVGNGTWLGTRAMILPGIEIGNAVIVGAGSIITKKLVDNNAYAGNPAKKIRAL